MKFKRKNIIDFSIVERALNGDTFSKFIKS